MGSYGSMEYMASNALVMMSCASLRSNSQAESQVQRVEQGEWVCELSLWAHWLHRGWMESATPSTLLTVDAQSFLKILPGHPELALIARHYGSALCKAALQEP